MTGAVAVTVIVAVAGRAYGCRRATRVGGGDTKQNQFFTEGKGKPIAATVEEWSRAPGTAQSLMGGNVATHEGTTCQVSPRVGWGCTGEG